jgi:drug/metabolite transporter (DMT)-like permease
VDAPGWLWVAFTIGGAGTQTVRNALQRGLTERLGTLGATHVRFLFGLPFGLVFLAVAWAAGGLAGVSLTGAWAAWTLMGAVFQIAGTALMLAAMRERAFVVAIAYVKTEPVQIALFGLVFLGERLGPMAMVAVLVATAGVLLMSLPEARDAEASDAPAGPSAPGLRPALLGIASGAMFALSAVGFRGGIVTLGEAPFAGRAVATLAGSLVLQTALLTGWLLARDPAVLRAILRAWRPSLAAGVTGALASLMWFLAFSLQSAAAVRTVGLVEILFAQAASRRLFAQTPGRREALGIALMVLGLALLLNAQEGA